MISSYEKVLTLCQILACLLPWYLGVFYCSIFKNVDVPSTSKLKKTRKNAKMTNLMTSLSDDDVITESFYMYQCTCQRIIFQMCGLPLLYLKKCGHNLTPRFLALGKPCIYISISDKSHGWLANSSPLEVTRMRFIIYVTCTLKLFIGGQSSVFGFWNHRHRNRHEILHKNGGLTFVEVQSWKILFLGVPRGHFGGFSWGFGRLKPSP